MLKSLQRRLKEWVRSDEFDDEPRQSLEDKISSVPLLKATVYSAMGGQVIELQGYDDPDRDYYDLYVIEQNKDFCQELAQILSDHINGVKNK